MGFPDDDYLDAQYEHEQQQQQQQQAEADDRSGNEEF